MDATVCVSQVLSHPLRSDRHSTGWYVFQLSLKFVFWIIHSFFRKKLNLNTKSLQLLADSFFIRYEMTQKQQTWKMSESFIKHMRSFLILGFLLERTSISKSNTFFIYREWPFLTWLWFFQPLNEDLVWSQKKQHGKNLLISYNEQI